MLVTLNSLKLGNPFHLLIQDLLNSVKFSPTLSYFILYNDLIFKKGIPFSLLQELPLSACWFFYSELNPPGLLSGHSLLLQYLESISSVFFPSLLTFCMESVLFLTIPNAISNVTCSPLFIP